MNIAETRSEMLACVVALQKKLAGVSEPAERLRLAEGAKRQIERIKKRFKHKIDERAGRRGGFAVHEREGIEGELVKAAAAALALIERVVTES
jgi:hypothetical protein